MSIYGRPTSEASFPFIIYHTLCKITPRNPQQMLLKKVNRLDWAHVVLTCVHFHWLRGQVPECNDVRLHDDGRRCVNTAKAAQFVASLKLVSN